MLFQIILNLLTLPFLIEFSSSNAPGKSKLVEKTSVEILLAILVFQAECSSFFKRLILRAKECD
jgi:hypothetical protein